MKGKPNNYYENLLVWQKAIDLVECIYTATKQFPTEELYGLTSQIRRCAVSVPSNIAEGATRNSQKEFIQFISIAEGSIAELKTQIIISNRVQLMDESVFNGLEERLNEIAKMLNGLKRKLDNEKPTIKAVT